MRILGIDPGYDRVGIAIIENNSLIHSECYISSKEDTFQERLVAIGTRVSEVISKYKPVCASIEKTFFSTNRKTAISVSEARGVLLYEIARARIPVHEYTPPEIKVAVTGYGKSTKGDVAQMLPKLITLDKEIQYDDEYDAIAIALTHAAQAVFKNNQLT